MSFDWLAMGTKIEAMSLPPGAGAVRRPRPGVLEGLRTEMRGESLRTK